MYMKSFSLVPKQEFIGKEHVILTRGRTTYEEELKQKRMIAKTRVQAECLLVNLINRRASGTDMPPFESEQNVLPKGCPVMRVCCVCSLLN